MTSGRSVCDIADELGYMGADGFYMEEETPPEVEDYARKVGVDAVYGKETDDGSYLPLVYFKEFDSYDSRHVKDLYEKVWNQSQVPLLILILPDKVKIYNCSEKPPFEPGEDIDDEKRILKTLQIESEIVNSEEELSFSKSKVENIEFWRDSSDLFKEGTRVDEQLLSHLLSLRNALSEDLKEEYVNNLVVKTVFVKYLEDRDILDEEFYRTNGFEVSNFRELLPSVESVYQFFSVIKEEFNGEIFEPVEGEEDSVDRENLESIRGFLNGRNLTTNQTQLSDFPYSFDIIPVELMSKVYERFVNSPEGDGVHYTPQPLAEYIVKDISDKDLENQVKILDPACGSGIFLVNALEKIIESREIEENRENLVEICKNELYGVDKNREAIQIAAFSLYLKMFEYLETEEIKESEFTLPDLIGESLFVNDFFDSRSEFNEYEFDLIVGNPPWGSYSIGNQSGAKEYAKNRIVGNKQLAQVFMWKSLDLAAEQAELCLLVPSDAVLMNEGEKTEKFRREYFSQTTVNSVVNLSILRHDLFDSATKPSAIVNLSNGETESQQEVQYVTPKSMESSLFRRVIIDSNFDVKYLPLEYVEKGFLWKTAMWGGIKDFELMLKLRQKTSLEDFCKEKDELKEPSEGFIANHSKAKEKESNLMPFTEELDYFNTRDFEKYRISEDVLTDYDGGDYFIRPKSQEMFESPLLIIKERATKRKIGQTSPRRIKSVYSENDVLFNQSFVGITSSESKSDILKILNLYLNSTLSQFYFFMSPNLWGVERPIISKDQIGTFPIELPERGTDEWELLLDTHEQILAAKQARNWEELEELRREADEIIYEIYDLTEKEKKLVKDRVEYTIDYFHNGEKAKASERVNYDKLKSYSMIISDSLNHMLGDEDYKLIPKIYVEKEARGLTSNQKIPLPAVSLIPVEESSEEQIREEDASEKIISELKERENASIIGKKGQKSFFRRNIQIFEEDRIHLIKPSELRFWTNAEALNDASELLGDLIGS